MKDAGFFSLGLKSGYELPDKNGSNLKRFKSKMLFRINSGHRFLLKYCNHAKYSEKENICPFPFDFLSDYPGSLTGALSLYHGIDCPSCSDRLCRANLFPGIRIPSGYAPLTILCYGNAVIANGKATGLTSPEVQILHIVSLKQKKAAA